MWRLREGSVSSRAGYRNHLLPPFPILLAGERITAIAIEHWNGIVDLIALRLGIIWPNPVGIFTFGLEDVRRESVWIIVAGVAPLARSTLG